MSRWFSFLQTHSSLPFVWIAILSLAGCSSVPNPQYIQHDNFAKTAVKTQAVLQFLPPTEEVSSQDISMDFLSEPGVLPASYKAVNNPTAPEESAMFALKTTQEHRPAKPSLGNNLLNDHLNFYAPESLIKMTGGLAIGAIIANTNVDRKLHQQFQRDFRGDDTDETYEFLHANKEWGNGRYTLPLFATAWATGKLFDESPTAVWTGEWGERSLRSFLVGAPPMLLFQRVTGASRPGETNNDSRWHPFQDANGVSGHSFMGALPFLNAARMTENRWLKATFYAGSTLAPLSRVNDDAHYPSQAALGWWFAYLAAASIDETQNTDQRWQFRPQLSTGQPGAAIEFRY